MPTGIVLNPKQARLELEVERVQELKARAEAASAAFEEAQAHLVKEFQAAGRKTLRYGSLKATLVERAVPKYDERGLAKALGAPVWNKITKKVLDKAKLEDAVSNGDIDVNVVAQYTTIQEQKPHLRFSVVAPDEE